MEITETPLTTPLVFPLPLYTSIPLGTAQSPEGDEFLIYAGLDKNLISELQKHSVDENDVDLMENTSDRKRFGEGSYEAWYAKGRMPFALVHKKTKALAAIAWFGPKPLGRKSAKHLSSDELKTDETSLDAGSWHTISFRSYIPFRGKKLMKDFGGFTLAHYIKLFPDASLWVGISPKNKGSIALSKSLGFTEYESASDREANWLVMIKK